MSQQLAALPDRHQLETELAGLQREQGAAVLDGREFPGADRLAKIQGQLDALEHAEAEQRRRELASADGAEQQRVAKLRAEIIAADAERLAAVENAQQAFGYLIGELSRALVLTGRIGSAGAALGAPSSLAIGLRETEKRFSRWIAAGLTEIGRTQEFGDIEWHGTPGACANWREAEQAVSGPAVALLLAGPAAVAGAPPLPCPASFNELHGLAEGDHR